MAKRPPDPETSDVSFPFPENPNGELTFACWLLDSDVEALKAGVVTPFLQKYATRMLALKDEAKIA